MILQKVHLMEVKPARTFSFSLRLVYCNICNSGISLFKSLRKLNQDKTDGRQQQFDVAILIYKKITI